MKFKNTYIGDASAIGSILTLLEIDRYGIKLNTSHKPYIIQVFCIEPKTPIVNHLQKRTHLYNSVIIFSLVKNVDEIRFSYDNEMNFCFSRKEINSFFELDEVTLGQNKDKWEKELLNKLDSENLVNSYYSKYNVHR